MAKPNIATQRKAKRELEAIYPDWREIIGAAPTEFRNWLARQPKAYQQKINDTWSPDDIVEAIGRFRTN